MVDVKGVYRVFLLILVIATAVSAQKGDALQNESAIESLKKRGQYDSLVKAFNEAQVKNGGETADLAVGQNSLLTAADGAAGDRFGSAVAMDGLTAAIGVPNDDGQRGSVYVFVRSGTVWTLEQKLTASDGQGSEFFGSSVDISGNTIIVGAIQEYDVDQLDAKGAAYIFSRSGVVWQQDRKITASDRQIGDKFGTSVAISGNVAAVGAPNADIGANSNQGAVYVYNGAGTVWIEQTKITAPDGAANDFFGETLAMDGNTFIVGVSRDDIGANTDQGSAYVFAGSGAVWTLQTKLESTVGMNPNDRFGFSVAIEGDTAVVGAIGYESFDVTNPGAVFVFTRTGTNWALLNLLYANDRKPNEGFGSSVGISGDLIVIGASNTVIHFNEGAAYLYKRTGNDFFEQQRFSAADSLLSDNFGVTAAISGDFLIVGSPNKNVGDNSSQGAAYAYRVLTNNWLFNSFKPEPFNTPNSLFGNSVAVSGEMAAIGASGSGVGGTVFVFSRTGAVWNLVTSFSGPQAGDRMGVSVAIYGNQQDATIVGGAPVANVGGNVEQGSVRIVRIKNGITVWSQNLVHPSGAAGDYFGSSVAISDNTVVVGAPYRDVTGHVDQGSALVFKGTGGVWSFESELTAFFGAANHSFGYDVDIFGNTIVVGSYQGGTINQGSVNVFARSPGGTIWTEQAEILPGDGAAGDRFGSRVAISNNTIIVGSPLHNSAQGAVYIYKGGGAFWTQQAKLTAPIAGLGFGSEVDLDGNTAIISRSVPTEAVFIFERTLSAWNATATLQYGALGDGFGISLAISGDYILAGVPLSDSTTPLPFANEAKQNLGSNRGGAAFFVNSIVPTAASVSIGGRVLTTNGGGLRNAIVTLTKENGETISARTNSFGYYRFDEIEVGQTVVVHVCAKGQIFQPRILNVIDNVTDFDFTAENLP